MQLNFPSHISSLSFKQYIFPALPLLALVLYLRRRHLASWRAKKVPPSEEHIIVLGASSGVGRVLAAQYARRGARVCLVARNEEGLEAARRECEDAFSGGEEKSENRLIAIVADFSNAEEMVRVRQRLQAEWGRLDTLAVIAGVSSLKPLLATAGVEREDDKSLPDANLHGVQSSVRIAGAALQGNFIGPLTAAVTFIPFLTRTSPAPAVLLLSSVAAVTPAPTRALYTATKSAALLLYQSLAIEHPEAHFTAILPATIEGDFRASAVDAGLVREADPNRRGLKRDAVARRCIRAVDRQERMVFMQGFYRAVPMLYYMIWPEVIEWAARKKYKYP